MVFGSFSNVLIRNVNFLGFSSLSNRGLSFRAGGRVVSWFAYESSSIPIREKVTAM